jgi:hypothetical protein
VKTKNQNRSRAEERIESTKTQACTHTGSSTGALAGWLLCCCSRPPALNPVHAGQQPQQHVDCRTGVGQWRGVDCRATGYP